VNPPFKIKTNVRIPELDGLRGLAILLVLFDHYLYGGLQPEAGILYSFVHAVFPLTWSGVDLFFVLSGFLIGGILMDQRQTENYFKTFYVRRVCRIFPIYFLWVLLFVVCSGLVSPHVQPPWAVPLFNRQGIPDWSYFAFLQNFPTAKTGLFGSAWLAVTWSLAVEEQFYLCMPLLVWLTPVRKLPYVLAILIILVPVFRLCLYLYYPQFFVYVLLPGRADSLLIGALCACWIRQEHSRSRLEKHRNGLFLAFAVLLVGMGWLTIKAETPGFWCMARSFDMISWGYSWIALFYACLLLIVITGTKGVIAGLMRFSPLRYLGIISYCVYLVHMAVLVLVHGWMLGEPAVITNLMSGAVTFTAFGTTLLLAALSWHSFEKPIIKWGHSFAYHGHKTRPVTRGTSSP
jgi:peptidoglycan/LPS O-acetylase OafA/YrhL